MLSIILKGLKAASDLALLGRMLFPQEEQDDVEGKGVSLSLWSLKIQQIGTNHTA